RRYQGPIDVLVGVLASVVNIVGMYTVHLPGMTFEEPDALGVLLQIGSGLPLAVRRRHPVAVAVVVSASYMALGILGYTSFAGGLVVLFAVYTLGAYASFLPGLLLCVVDGALTLVYFVVYADYLANFSVQLNFLTLLA